MPKVREADIVPQKRDRYPGNHKKVTSGYERLAVGDAVGLSQFGVNKVTVKPGAATALNHWHQNEDEFVIVLSGEVVLVEGDTETLLKAANARVLKRDPVGHHIINKSSEVAILFEVGTRCDNEVCHYTGLDFTYRKVNGVVTFVNKDGSIAS
ncbi:MAG: transcriptional regulator [Rhodospirillaceae bacterium]|nr:MAG: transcriptional regulator [Rhodospirillaceae bacterium]